MNVGIVVDASCDLPASILERHKINVIPLTVGGHNAPFMDARHPEESNQFYQSPNFHKLAAMNVNADITTASENFARALTDDWLYRFDNLLVIAPHRKLSTTLVSIRQSILDLQSTFDEHRRQAHLKNAFKIRVIESQSAYAGYGVVVYEALRLYSEKARSADQLKQPLEQFIPKIETYVLPGYAIDTPKILGNPLFQLGWLEQQKLRFTSKVPIFYITENGLSRYKYLMSTNVENNYLEIIYDKLTRTKLNNHLVNISYAGNLARLRVMPVFKALHEHVKNKGGRLVYSVMSPASGLRLGQQAISVSFSNKH